jgi:hypothetical protein
MMHTQVRMMIPYLKGRKKGRAVEGKRAKAEAPPLASEEPEPVRKEEKTRPERSVARPYYFVC